MKFGTLILSKKRSIRTNFWKLKGGGFCHATGLVVGTFIFQRPDNGKFIIEMEQNLVQEEPEDIFLLTKGSVQYFKKLIEDSYEEHKKENLKQIEQIKNEIRKEEEKATELQTNIDSIEKKNQIDFSENRAKNLRGLSKALRRHQKKIESLQLKVEELERKNQKYEKEKQVSLDFVEEQMKAYFV